MSIKGLDLYVTTLDFETEMLTDFEVSRKDNIYGEKILNLKIVETERNKHAFAYVNNENILLFDGEEYVIKTKKERIRNGKVIKECVALHRFFTDMKDSYIYDTISGTKRLNDLLSFVFQDVDFIYDAETDELPLSILVENFGDDTALSLFNKILERFGAEFDVLHSFVFVTKRLGYQTDTPLRYKLNVKDPQNEIDTSTLSTYIRGYGKPKEDGSYHAYQTYTSPLASIYGIRHAKPVRDERYTDNPSLLERIKSDLHDQIDINVTLTYVDFKKLGHVGDVHKGDTVWCILEPFNINVEARIVEIEEFTAPNKPSVFTLGTISKKATTDIAKFSATKKTVDKVINVDSNKIRREALDQDSNFVVEAIENTFGEVSYTDDISVSDPNNFMRKVGMRKGGIYRTVDGVYRQFVITPDGLDLEQVFGILAPEHIEIGPGTIFAQGYDPTQISLDPDELPLASEVTNGLMSKEDKTKLNRIDNSAGQVVDLSVLVQKIETLEVLVTQLESDNVILTQTIDSLEQRVEVLEGG